MKKKIEKHFKERESKFYKSFKGTKNKKLAADPDDLKNKTIKDESTHQEQTKVVSEK